MGPSFICSEGFGDLPEPYEQLLGDALQRKAGFFTREDSVEETWRIVQPMLDSPPPVETCAPTSWGPAGPKNSSPATPIGANRGYLRT